MSMQDAPAQVATVALSRQIILDATARALAEVGYDGTTIRKIASLLNCAVGSIYRYFTDKRQLLLAVAEQRMEAAAGIIESGGSFDQSVRAYLDSVLAEPETYRLMFWLCCIGRDQAQQPMLPQSVAGIIEGWGRRLGDGRLAERAWAMLHGSIMLGHPREQVLAAVHQMLSGSSRPTAATHATPVTSGQAMVKSTAAAAMLQAPVRMAMPVNVELRQPVGAAPAAVATPEDNDVCLL